jgi:hypothetical protein
MFAYFTYQKCTYQHELHILEPLHTCARIACIRNYSTISPQLCTSAFCVYISAYLMYICILCIFLYCVKYVCILCIHLHILYMSAFLHTSACRMYACIFCMHLHISYMSTFSEYISMSYVCIHLVLISAYPMHVCMYVSISRSLDTLTHER